MKDEDDGAEVDVPSVASEPDIENDAPPFPLSTPSEDSEGLIDGDL
jgi:hypothetical protein